MLPFWRERASYLLPTVKRKDISKRRICLKEAHSSFLKKGGRSFEDANTLDEYKKEFVSTKKNEVFLLEIMVNIMHECTFFQK